MRVTPASEPGSIFRRLQSALEYWIPDRVRDDKRRVEPRFQAANKIRSIQF
jgi:hypothetical protein